MAIQLASNQIIERSFAVMGNTAHITLVGGDVADLDFAQCRLVELENLWSRFLASSEVTRLNLADGAPVSVHPETVRLVKFMIVGRQITNGLFNPTLLPALVANGYGRSRVEVSHITLLPDGARFNESLDMVVIDESALTICLPKGLTLDPGAIGKGLAADIVATELMNRNVAGVCVNVGGDIRSVGMGNDSGSWRLDIASPFDESVIGTLRLQDGAVATSCVSSKTWVHEGVLQHHVLSPDTGASREQTQHSFVQASVVARECVWAEVFATALLLAEPKTGFAMIDENNLAALIVRADQKVFQSLLWSRFDV
jgi:thiamine biosynthesis lipoprotein